MGTRPTLIDLGVYSREHGPEPLLAPERPVPLPAARSWRWWPVVLATLLLWPLAGAAAAPVPPLTLLWTEPEGARSSSEIAVGDTDLYAVTAAADGPALTAFRLADGSVRWEVPLVTPGGPEWPSGTQDMGVRLINGMLFVLSYQLPETVAAYDPATAQLRWTGEGFPEPIGPDRVVLSAVWRDSPGVRSEIRELDTGAVVASFDHTAGQFAYQVSPDAPARVVGLSRDGALTSYDPFSGAVLRRVETPYEEVLDAGYQNGVSISDDLVLVTGYADGLDLVAFDLATLTPLWTIPDGMGATPCAPVLCVATVRPDGLPGELRGVDPVTGTVQWSMSCADGGTEQCFLAVREPWSDGRVLVEDWALDGSGQGTGFWVIDTVTGRPLVEPGQWRFVASSGESLLLSRGEGELWLAWADPELERIEVLGSVEADWCTPYGSHLVCNTGGQPFQVWRLSPPAA